MKFYMYLTYRKNTEHCMVYTQAGKSRSDSLPTNDGYIQKESVDTEL